MSILEVPGLLVGLHLFTSHQLLFYSTPPDMIDLLLAPVLLVSELPWYFVSKSFLPCTHTHQTPHTSKHTLRTYTDAQPCLQPQQRNRRRWLKPLPCTEVMGPRAALHIVLLYFSIALAVLLCLEDAA